MQDLYDRIASAADISPDAARSAVANILAFMQTESEDPAVSQMISGTPGAAEAAGSTDATYEGGGVMALGGKLMALGLDMGQIRQVAEEFGAYFKEKAGADTVDRAIASVPGLSQFV